MSAPLRLRWAMHAFPRRFRADRAVEIEATFHEAEAAGDRHPYGARALGDVVVAGWGERARTRPPLGVYLAYRTLDRRLDPRWHRWMFDDVDGRLFALRQSLAVYIWIPIIFLVMGMTTGGWPGDAEFLIMYMSSTMVFSFVGARSTRRRVLRRHGYDPKTRLWMPPDVLAAMEPRLPRRTRVTPIAFTMAAALGVVAPFAVLSSLGWIGAGVNQNREADGQVPITIAAVVLAIVLGVVGAAQQRRVAGRFTTEVPTSSDPDLVFSDLPAAGGLAAILAGLGLAACWYPIVPLIVPMALVVLAGAIPALIMIAIDAQRRVECNDATHESEDVVVVWTRRSAHRTTSTSTPER